MGANLGYYTKIFSDLVGKSGKVIVIEPIQSYMGTIQSKMGDTKNCDYYNNALGAEEKDITMTSPSTFGYFRPGLSRVKDASKDERSEYEFPTKMVRASSILKKYPKIDYIKVDIEEYETIVIPEIMDELKLKKPMIQIELWGNAFEVINTLLTGIGYQFYILENGILMGNQPFSRAFGDILYIHSDHISAIENKLLEKKLMAP
jgi:FkbM family methyltransferase